MNTTTILIVDDDTRILQTFSRALTLADYTVFTAGNGERGLEIYHQEDPDMVLLDLRMPGKDGLEVLQAIRQHDPEANVILTTGHGDKDAVIKALRAGAADFLPKPIDRVTLESALRRAEERIHLKRKLRASEEALRQKNAQLEATVQARTEELTETVAALRERVKEQTCLYAVNREMQEDLSVDELCQRVVGHLVTAMQFPEITVPVIELHGERFSSGNETEDLSHALSADIRAEGETCGRLWVYYEEERPFLLPEEQNLINGIAEALSTWLERRRVEKALQASERQFRTLFETMTEGVALHRVIYDEAGIPVDYVLVNANPAYQHHTGISVEEARGRKASELYGAEGPPYLDLYARVAETGEPTAFETYFPPMKRHFSISVFSPAEGQFATVFEDISEQKQGEETLRESEARLRRIFDAAPIGIGTVVDRKIQFANAEICRMLGRSLDELAGKDAHILYPDEQEYQRIGEEKLPQVMKYGSASIETRFQRKDGTVLDILLSSALINPSDPSKGIISTAVDITERRQAEEALRWTTKRLRILREIDAAILGAQSPQEIARAALAHLYDLIPYRRASITEIDTARQRGRDLVVLIDGEQEAGERRWHPFSAAPSLIDTILGGAAHQVEDIAALETTSSLEENLEATGTRSYVSVPLRSGDELAGALNLTSDRPGFFEADHTEMMTEIADSLSIALKQARLLEQTQEDAETKTLLLQEVNHRVLNNLAAIMGILDLEKRRSLGDVADLRAVLDDVAHRIGGMTTVHRMLSSAQWQPLDVKDVVERVVYAALSGSPTRHNIRVKVDAPGEAVHVPSKQAISLALVINELTTNSVKYAFQDRAQGRIDLEITLPDEETVQIIFRDDGPGIPEAVLAGERHAVGLGLVEANVRHTLGGEVDYHNDGGAVVALTFKRALQENA